MSDSQKESLDDARCTDICNLNRLEQTVVYYTSEIAEAESAPRNADETLVAAMGDPPAGTRVYVTALPGSPLAENAALCSRLRAAGESVDQRENCPGRAHLVGRLRPQRNDTIHTQLSQYQDPMWTHSFFFFR